MKTQLAVIVYQPQLGAESCSGFPLGFKKSKEDSECTLSPVLMGQQHPSSKLWGQQGSPMKEPPKGR